MDDRIVYQKLNVPELKLIQDEALEYLKKHYSNLFEDGVITDDYFILSIDSFPILKSFLDSRVTTCIEEIGLVCVAPNNGSLIHLDGLKKDDDGNYIRQVKETIINQPDFEILNLQSKIDKLPIPFCVEYAMMVPLINYEDTTNYWYNNDDVGDDDEDIKRYTRETYPYSFFASYLKPDRILTPIDSTNIDRITFIKTNIFHNVVNRGPKTRMAFTIKFGYQHYESIEEMFRHQDLL